MKSIRSAAFASKSPATGTPRWLLSIQIFVGVVVSASAAFISWQAHNLAVKAEESNNRLKSIEQELAQSKFGFERTRDIYDRTEKYLSSSIKDQDEARGRVLVALIGSIPDETVRIQLLTVVTEAAKRNVVAAQAAKLNLARPATQTLASALQPTQSPTPVSENASSTGLVVPAFSGVQQIAIDSDRYKATTLGPIRFSDSKGRIWDVPKGIVVSGDTVPRAVWSIIGPPLTSSYTMATVMHEYYYREQTRPRDEVDLMFLEALVASGVPKSTANTIYQAVRMFGGSVWDASSKTRINRPVF